MFEQELNAIKEGIKNSLLQFPDTIEFQHIHFSVLEEVLEDMGWELDWDSYDDNGWQHDFWIEVFVPDKKFYYLISGSWYYSETTFDKKHDDN